MDYGSGDMVLTNLGPLPTNFAVNSNCVPDLTDVYKYFTTSPGWYFLLQGPVEQTSCYPSGYTADSRQYYSPARCPTGFTSACQSHNVAGTIEETVVRCCPTYSDFVCQTKINYSWEKTLGCINQQETATTTVWTVSQVSNGITALSTYTNAIGGVNAYQIQVGFQSTDFASSTSTSSRTSDSSTVSQTPRPTAPGTTTGASSGSLADHGGSSSSTKHNTNLSGGAIAGIIIGALAGLLLVVALVWLQVRNRRRRRQQAEDNPNRQELDAPPSAPATETIKRENAVELDAGEARPSKNLRWG
ncbi:hypothetical protein F4782DRAFT_497094 [Xylaria castorea]|nr:hypothetical protein F4782DRAFT_497094 [Xylaria castorea]